MQSHFPLQTFLFQSSVLFPYAVLLDWQRSFHFWMELLHQFSFVRSCLSYVVSCAFLMLFLQFPFSSLSFEGVFLNAVRCRFISVHFLQLLYDVFVLYKAYCCLRSARLFLCDVFPFLCGS